MSRESMKDDITQRTPTILKGPTCSYCLEEGVVDWKWENCKHYSSKNMSWQKENVNTLEKAEEYLCRFRDDIVFPLTNLSFEYSNEELGIMPLPRHARYEDGSIVKDVEERSGKDISVVPLLPAHIPTKLQDYDTFDTVIFHMIECLFYIRKKFNNPSTIYAYPTGSLNVSNSCFAHALATVLANLETNWTVMEVFSEGKVGTRAKDSPNEYQEYPYSGHYFVEKIRTLEERIKYLESELEKEEE